VAITLCAEWKKDVEMMALKANKWVFTIGKALVYDELKKRIQNTRLPCHPILQTKKPITPRPRGERVSKRFRTLFFHCAQTEIPSLAPHICVISRGDGGIDKGVVGY
jgi:hypothetical protein